MSGTNTTLEVITSSSGMETDYSSTGAVIIGASAGGAAFFLLLVCCVVVVVLALIRRKRGTATYATVKIKAGKKPMEGITNAMYTCKS